jgi:MoxR-like ATPase
MGYPDPRAELAMLDAHGRTDPLDDLGPVADAATVRALIGTVRNIHVSESVKQYAIDLVTATREAPELRLGASPRATLQLLRTARATAALDGREFVLPDDLQSLAGPVLAHRILPSAEAQINRRGTDQIVASLVARVPVPTARDSHGGR